MLFYQRDAEGKVSAVTDKVPAGEHGKWEGRHSIKTLEQARRIASEATTLTGRLHTGVDNGPSVWPRYDFIEAPKVGDKVSYAFNGDYYPDGEITHVTTGTLRVIKTSGGHTYYRRRNTDHWVQQGGTWSLVQGHCTDKNPEF